MEQKMTIMFYGKKIRLNDATIVSIYLRATINGQRFEVTTKRTIESNKWNQLTGKVKGNLEEARSINTHLDIMRNKVYDYQRLILQEGNIFTKEELKNKWFGIEEQSHSLVSFFQKHNDQLKSLIGKDNTKATHTKYCTTLDHLISFLQWKFKKSDINISKINYSFITDFEFYLKSEKNCNHNTTIKYISNTRKIINNCLKNGWINKDPFTGFKMTKKEVVREILTEKELETLQQKELANQRLRQVRDIFIFSCFTGLAYIDAKRLKRSQVVTDTEGEHWIYTTRKKTDTPTRIPLLPPVIDIMKIYEDHPQCKIEDSLLPIPTNQKLNAYLKELADICGINKLLTFHIARHTFATTVTLNNGVPIESVSKMLGHKSIKITQIYAKVMDKKLSEDMKGLKEKYKSFGLENSH